MTELTGFQLAWELALAVYLLGLLCLWNRSPLPGGSWSLEAASLLLAQALVVALYSLLEGNRGPHGLLHGCTLALCLAGWWVAYWVIRLSQCRGDRMLLPLACLLSGVGWVMILRLSHMLAFRQALWLMLGLASLMVITTWLRDLDTLDRYRWVLLSLAAGLQAGLLFFGEERNGAALWYVFGPISLQPVEFVKVLASLLVASFLCRSLPQFHRVQRISRRNLLGIVLGWALLEGLLVLQRDLGVALLFFGVFVCLLYAVSGRLSWVVGVLALSSLGALAGYLLFGHVRVRVEAWLDPLASYSGSGYQISEALFSLAAGGWWGVGLGLGEPWRIPEAVTDFIFVAWCEEMGVFGGILLWAALLMFLLRCFRAGRRSTRPFEQILALSLAVVLSWQTCIVLFGVLKIMPMTGITLPFISYGGSSLLSNFVVLALLQRISQNEL